MVAARLVALWALLVLAGCSTRTPTPPPAPAPNPAPAPAAPVLGFTGLSGPEQVWHLRSALNVAALGCPRSPTLVADYNRLLRSRKDALAAAYRGETAVFRQRHGADWQPPFDRYMTGLYNRLAAPRAQVAFCPVAEAIAAEALAIGPDRLEAFAGPALARIDAAFAAPEPAPEPAPRAIVAAARTVPPAAPPAAGWRVQIGAYTGQAAATAAWQTIRTRQPGLAAYAPRFEPVPARPELVRLQLGGAADRGSALTLCALAAAGGFDCIPLRPAGQGPAS